MAKKEITGKCALCGRDNMILKQSHIIPKLIYKRAKTYENSRFRNFTNLNQIYQDGEKKPPCSVMIARNILANMKQNFQTNFLINT